MFNAKKYFESRNIRYWNEGEKNVSKGWVNITCPFCPDHSNHMGINLKNDKISCWLCNKKGYPATLIQKLENVSFKQAKKIAKEFGDNFIPEEYEEENKPHNTTCFFPKEATKDFTKKQLDYLKNRNYNPSSIIKKYDLYSSGILGKFKRRIIVPIYLNGKLVNFTARTIVEGVEPKYKHCPNEKAVLPINNCLYNYDNITENKCIIVEGVTDVWRIGKYSIGVFGKIMSTHQIELLLEKEINKVVVFLDPDAFKEANDLANRLTAFIPVVELWTPEEDDPGSLTTKEVNKLLINF